jgi:pimeloyl-ACP methyl ester carboxylesterase
MTRRRAGFGVAGLVCVAALPLAASAVADAAGESTVPDSSIAPPATSTGEQSDAGAIEWVELQPGLEEGWVEVPIDYSNPEAGVFRIYVMRRLADEPSARVGSLFVNPGGPGFGGSDFVTYADQFLPDEVTDSFDLIGFDPRGTGRSEPAIDCIDDYDHFNSGTDITPDDDAERQQIVDLAEEFAAACETNNADIIQFVGTNNAARDIDSIRQALGEEQVSFVGISYGGQLGGAWATLFPDTVRAAVFDGAGDPDADELEGALAQVASFEDVLTTYLAQCSADPSCLFHNDGDAEGAFDELMLELDDRPIPSTEGRPDITRGVALVAVAQTMYDDSLWPDLSGALTAAQRGDGFFLLRLYDDYFLRNPDGTWGDELEAFQTISCMDLDERRSVEEEDAAAPLYTEVAPRFAPPNSIGSGAYFCTFFPESTDPLIDITGTGAGPIVLCGTTGNASTPLEGTRAMADSLEDGRLILVDDVGSACLGVSDCGDQLMTDYLVDLEVPPEETVCPPD